MLGVGTAVLVVALWWLMDAEAAVPSGLFVEMDGSPAIESGQVTAEFLNQSASIFFDGSVHVGNGRWVWLEPSQASCLVFLSYSVVSSEGSIMTDISVSTSLNQSNVLPSIPVDFSVAFNCDLRAIIRIEFVFIVYHIGGTIYDPVSLQFLKKCQLPSCERTCIHGYCDLNLAECVCDPGWHNTDCSIFLETNASCPGQPLIISFWLPDNYITYLDWFAIYPDPIPNPWSLLEWRYFSSWSDTVLSTDPITGNLTGTNHLDLYLPPGNYLVAIFLGDSNEYVTLIPFTIDDWVTCNITSTYSNPVCVHGAVDNATSNSCVCEPYYFWWDCSRGCALETTVNTMSGLIASDDPPSAYDQIYLTNTNCTWILNPGSSHFNFKLTLEMVDFFDSDFVIIYTLKEESSTPHQFTSIGSDAIYPQTFLAENVHSLRIWFMSDYVHTSKGFRMSWTATTVSNSNMIAVKWSIGVILLCFQIILTAVVAIRIYQWRKKRVAIMPENIELTSLPWKNAEEETQHFLESGVIGCEGLYAKPLKLSFGIPESVAFPVGSEKTEIITLFNRTPCEYKFTFYIPQEPHLFTCQAKPGQGKLPPLSAIQVQVSFQLMYTTIFQRYMKAEITSSTGELISVFLFEIALKGEVSDNLDPAELTIETAPVASGGFGVVYRGVYRKQMVAIKVPKRQHNLLDYELATFESEVKLMKRLHGKYIVTFIGASLVPGKLCIVTEFHELGSLSQFIHSPQTLPYEFQVKIATDIAKAMLFLHSHSVIYRDLKCTNILMVSTSPSAKLHCKLTDFGSAKNVPTLAELFSHTGCIGTPAYMAPEMLDNKLYNHKVDVYSFAIIFWEVLTQEHPWGTSKPWDIPHMVLSGSRPQFPEDCQSKARGIIGQCWRHDPESRPEFSSILEFLKAMNPHRKEKRHKHNSCFPATHQNYLGDAADGFAKSHKLLPLLTNNPPSIPTSPHVSFKTQNTCNSNYTAYVGECIAPQSCVSEQTDIQTSTSVKTSTTASCGSRMTDVTIQVHLRSATGSFDGNHHNNHVPEPDTPTGTVSPTVL
ncbi:serine/threonine-protein kinase STY17 [Pelomyxa schiedti]|nr:serine/threonine-protein kinase STY17 [Pelomyxa schiedti]